MERQELIAKVSERSGIDAEVCKKVLDAFYEPCEHTGESLVDRLRAMKHHDSEVVGELPTSPLDKISPEGEHQLNIDIPAEISEKTGISLNDVENVLHALKDEIDPGIVERLKHLLSRK